MTGPIKTRALERAAHERRLLAIIEERLAEMSPREREVRVRAALTLDMWNEVLPKTQEVWGYGELPTATVIPTAKVKPKSWRHQQAEKTSVSAEKRYGRKR